MSNLSDYSRGNALVSISVLPVYPMHAKAMSLVPKGISLYLLEV